MKEKNGFVNRIIIVLCFLGAFIPLMGAHDIINTQWFYLSIVNFLSLAYIFFKRNDYNINKTSKLTKAVFAGGFLFLLIALLSITKSLLVSESIVMLSYLTLTLISLFVFYLVIKQNPKKYFIFFSLLVVLIGVLESLQVIQYFNIHNKEIRSVELIKALKHNYGNRNILAISIAMKFPFIFYFYIQEKKIYKFLSGLSLLLLFISILLIGARTAIFGGVIILVLLLGYLFLVNLKTKKIFLKEILGLLAIVGISLFISLSLNKVHGAKLNSFNDLIFTKHKKKLLYTKINTSNKVNLYSSSDRDKFWMAAIEDIKKNPFLGVGLGNWKLMPKEVLLKTTNKRRYFYPRRVHNDFLQVFSEIGVFGFLLYFLLYIVIIGVLLKRILINIKKSKNEAFIAVILLSVFSIYFFDSFFNFPHERTPIQFFIFFTLALILSFTPSETIIKINKGPILICALLLNTVFVCTTFKSYKASKIHRVLYNDIKDKDFFKEKYNTSYEEVLKKLPDYPELDGYGRPTVIMKSFFAYNSKEKEKAMFHLNVAMKKFPYYAEPFGVKALLYLKDKDLKNKDSAFYYAKKSFEIQPSKQQNFEILRRHYLNNKDTINLIKTLNIYTDVVKNDVDAWIKKAQHLYLYKKNYDRFLEVIDSAVMYNPRNDKIVSYRKKIFRLNKERK